MKHFASVTETPCTCHYLKGKSRDADWPIEFDARLNEYHIVTNGAHGKDQGMIHHCPWCGGEAPKSIRDQLFATVSNSEDYRLREIVREFQSYDEAKQSLGPPDWEPFPGTVVTLPPSDGQPPEREAFREAHYKNLSDVADLVLIDYPNRRLCVRVSAKYTGLPGEKPAKPKALRNIPPVMDPAVVAEIDARLDEVERREKVKILLAIESGSRAWGFPSPDSDYDCRFVYVRRSSDYMTLFAPRDVIETPMTEVLDVNGWDIAKALRLLLAGNAVIVEWLTSPIIYRGDADFRQQFLELASGLADRNSFARHYLHLGRNVLADNLAEDGDVPLKKLFYALRPAMALRWLRLHPTDRVAPMNFLDLMAGCDLSNDIQSVIDNLLRRKAATRELGRGPLPPGIRDFIAAEFTAAENIYSGRGPIDDDQQQTADTFFHRVIARWGVKAFA